MTQNPALRYGKWLAFPWSQQKYANRAQEGLFYFKSIYGKKRLPIDRGDCLCWCSLNKTVNTGWWIKRLPIPGKVKVLPSSKSKVRTWPCFFQYLKGQQDDFAFKKKKKKEEELDCANRACSSINIIWFCSLNMFCSISYTKDSLWALTHDVCSPSSTLHDSRYLAGCAPATGDAQLISLISIFCVQAMSFGGQICVTVHLYLFSIWVRQHCFMKRDYFSKFRRPPGHLSSRRKGISPFRCFPSKFPLKPFFLSCNSLSGASVRAASS